LLVVGFSNGLFGLYDLPEFNTIHLLRYVSHIDLSFNYLLTNPVTVSLRATLML
jgi:hypothetical protein